MYDFRKRFMLTNLQLFADGEQDIQEDKEEIQETETFTQDDIDKAVQKAVDEAKEKWQSELDTQKTEAQKLANMSEKEKQKYQEEKRSKDLDDREAAITRRELTAQAKVQLADKGIPTELAEILVLTDADSCKKSIETVEKAFQLAVEKAVNERIKGVKPIKKAPQVGNITVESIRNMSTDEINANWDEVQNVLKGNK